MQKAMDYFKQYIGVISIVLALCILLTYSLSYFKVNIDNKRAAEMYIGDLKYTISIDGTSTNTLTIPSGETIVDIDLTNQNEIKTYYKLLYLKNANISISYFNQTKNTSDELTSYKSPGDLVESKSVNNLKLKILNNSASSQTLTFKVSGGYSTNTLADVEVPNTYTEITSLETPSTNTYFCKTNDTLTQGLKYVDGQYTYGYKQRGYINRYKPDTLVWSNMDADSWGVMLTNRTSTETVNSKVCTYINNKPIVDMSFMFYNSKATTLDLSSFNTSKVTNMSYMFSSTKATTLNLSNFDTSKVTNMSSMFQYSGATTLDVSSFNTSNVTNMAGMFYYSKATTLDLSKFNTSKVTDMSSMFSNTQATILDVSNFDTSNVTNMASMFSSTKATTLNLSNFDTSKVTDMSYMFSDSKATTLYVSSFNTSNVTNMASMFSNTQATTLDLSKFNTSNVTNMAGMFYYSKATTLDLSKFNTSKVTDMSSMFSNTQATILDVSNFDTSNVTNMASMFSSTKATTLNLSKFNTSKVRNMRNMFMSADVKTIYVSDKFVTSTVTNSDYMFNGCTNLVGGAGTVYDKNHVTVLYARIDGGTSSPGYFTSK